MKILTSAALLIGGALMTSQSVFGAITDNDLYLGFQNQAGGGTEDYIIDLGQASSLINAPGTVDLSGDFSLSDFDAVLGSSTSMMGGVVGAANNGNPSDVYLTLARSGGAGDPATPGSSLGATLSRSQDNETFSAISSLNGPAVGTGILDTTKTWESQVEPANTPSTFLGVTGINPDSSVSPTSVFYADLWSTSSSSVTGGKPFVYDGYLTLDLTGSSPSLTFTPVPEPATVSLLAGGGLLLLSLRRKA